MDSPEPWPAMASALNWVYPGQNSCWRYRSLIPNHCHVKGAKPGQTRGQRGEQGYGCPLGASAVSAESHVSVSNVDLFTDRCVVISVLLGCEHIQGLSCKGRELPIL